MRDRMVHPNTYITCGYCAVFASTKAIELTESR